MRGDGALMALLVLLGSTASAAAAAVPPPENVHVSCQNAIVTVTWDYSQHQPETSYRIAINTPDGKIQTYETTDRHYDLTHFVWKSQEHYLKVHFVNVTALQGGNQSENVSSNTFTFKSFQTVNTKCSLDFPPVKILVDEGTATVSFSNPMHHYKEVDQTIKQGFEPTFTFAVSSVDNGTKIGDVGGTCSVNDPVCKVEVQLPEDVETPCFILKRGSLFNHIEIQSVNFTDSKETCAPDSAESEEVILAVILTAVALFLIIMGVIVICKVRAWTLKTTPLPLSWDPTSLKRDQKFQYGTDEDEDLIISPVSVEKASKNLANTCEEPEDSQSSMARGTNLDSDYTKRALYTEGPSSESSSQADSGSAETECATMESDEEETREESPYDCPHNIMVDMGEGDMAIGYGGN